MYLTKRVNKIRPSSTLKMKQMATELKMKGKNIISLATGEPDFDTPENIKQAAVKAINDGHTKYTAVDGIPELKEAICNKFYNQNNLNFKPENILVSTGAKQSLYNLIQSLVQSSDEVIIPAPYWVSYPDMVLLAEGVPVIIPTSVENNFKVTAEQIKNCISVKTKAIILNSPANPTGQAYSKSELQEIANLLIDYPKIAIIYDEIYEHIWWGNEPLCNIANVCPELYDRVFIINGVSKSYAMTGWRIGYMAGDAQIIKACSKMQSHSTSNPTSISQYAALEALVGDQSFLATANKIYQTRNNLILKELKKIPNIKTLPSFGSFYTFPDFNDIIKAGNFDNDVALVEHILAEALVACVPGSAFGAPGCIRLSYATSEESIINAVDRIHKCLANI